MEYDLKSIKFAPEGVPTYCVKILTFVFHNIIQDVMKRISRSVGIQCDQMENITCKWIKIQALYTVER